MADNQQATKKPNELDVVVLVQDPPQYGLNRGARGTVVEFFDQPEEAYMLEFVEESGTGPVIADRVKPEQIETLRRHM